MPFYKWTDIEQFHNIWKTMQYHWNAHLENSSLAFPVIHYKTKVKLHGTNASIQLHKDKEPVFQSRKRIITIEKDNYGFAAWATKFAKQFDLVETDTLIIDGEWIGCFTYSTPITLSDGSKEPIGRIVNQKKKLDVLTYNINTGKLESKKIIGWLKKEDNNDWITLTFKRRHRGGNSTKLIVTKNHKIFRESQNGMEEVCASSLKEKDIVYTNGKLLNYYQLQFIKGSLLGDSSFACYGSMECSHSDDNQPFYNNFIRKFLKEIISNETSVISGHNSNMKKFYTISLPEIKDLYDLLVKDNRKSPSIEYLNKLHPAALAIWYMDDGNICSGKNNRQYQCELNTLRYTKEENNIIIKWFCDHGFRCYICTQDSKYLIRFTPDGAEQFFNVIAPYVLPEFSYKIPPYLHSITKFDWNNTGLKNGIIKTEVLSVKEGSIYKDKSRRTRYDIEIEDNHNYFANNILVHNSGVQQAVAASEISEKAFCIFSMRYINQNENMMILTEPSLIKQELDWITKDNSTWKGAHVIPWYKDDKTNEDLSFVIDLSDRDQTQREANYINYHVDRIEKEDPFIKDTFGISGMGEGLVAYPVLVGHHNKLDDLYSISYWSYFDLVSKYLFKAKGEKHRVVKQKAPVIMNAETVSSIQEFVDKVVTEQRLQQGFQEELNNTADIKKMGDFIKWVNKDVIKECQDEFLQLNIEWKKVAPHITRKAKEWLLQKITQSQ